MWKENRVVAPISELKVLDQVREGSHLDVAEGDEKNALDTETPIDYFELPTKQGNVGEEVDVCISPIDSKKVKALLNAKNYLKVATFQK